VDSGLTLRGHSGAITCPLIATGSQLHQQWQLLEQASRTALPSGETPDARECFKMLTIVSAYFADDEESRATRRHIAEDAIPKNVL
jgi:hypothetical protein